jgi:hypothetical protein
MALTRDYKETVLADIKRDPKFARALYAEVVNSLLKGETGTFHFVRFGSRRNYFQAIGEANRLWRKSASPDVGQKRKSDDAQFVRDYKNNFR